VNSLRPAWVPAGIVGLTALGAWLLSLPAGLADLRMLGPYALLGIAAVLSWWFNRGRTFVIAASLLGAFAALEVFPPDNPWNAVVTDWPLHPNSKNIITSIGLNKPMRYNPDMAFVLVPADQKRIDVKLGEYAHESDKGPYPVPDNMPIEGWPASYQRNGKTKSLSLEVARPADTATRLRHAMRAISRFARDNRHFIARLMADALSGEACAREFLRDNLPRHLDVMRNVVAQGQKEGVFVPVPLPQAMGVCAGAMAMPILVGGAMIDSGMLDPATARMIEATLLSDAALDQRIELAVKAIHQPPAAARARAKRTAKPRGKP